MPDLLTFLIASALLSLAPGPDNLFVLTQSAIHGRKAGLLIIIGLCTGLVVHTFAVAMGLAAIFAASATAFTVVKLAGAAYLLYLAWQAFQAGKVNDNAEKPTSLSGTSLYRRGILMNLSNPKVTLFFLAFLPQFTSLEKGSVTLQLLVLGSIFILVTLVVFSAIALLAERLSRRLRKNPKTQRWMNRLCGLLFSALALRLLISSR